MNFVEESVVKSNLVGTAFETNLSANSTLKATEITRKFTNKNKDLSRVMYNYFMACTDVDVFNINELIGYVDTKSAKKQFMEFAEFNSLTAKISRDKMSRVSNELNVSFTTPSLYIETNQYNEAENKYLFSVIAKATKMVGDYKDQNISVDVADDTCILIIDIVIDLKDHSFEINHNIACKDFNGLTKLVEKPVEEEINVEDAEPVATTVTKIEYPESYKRFFEDIEGI